MIDILSVIKDIFSAATTVVTFLLLCKTLVPSIPRVWYSLCNWIYGLTCKKGERYSKPAKATKGFYPFWRSWNFLKHQIGYRGWCRAILFFCLAQIVGDPKQCYHCRRMVLEEDSTCLHCLKNPDPPRWTL